MKSTWMFVAMLVCVGAVSAADLTMTIKTTGAVNDVSTTYMSATAIRSNSPGFGMDVLTDVQKGVSYTINHKTRSVSFTRFADLPGFAAFVSSHMPKGKQMAQFNAGMDDMYGDPSVFKVESTGKEIVDGRSCNKTRISSGKLVWEYSMDPTLRSPIDPGAMLAMTRAKYTSLAAYPKMAKIMNNMIEATAKLPGVALRTRMSGYNGVTVAEVTSVKEGAIPASVFALPAGYAMKDQIAESEKAMAARH